MRRRPAVVLGVVGVCGIAVVATALVQNREDPFPAPTEAEARAVLAGHVAALGPQPRKDWYCNHVEADAGQCWKDWDGAGGDEAAPTTAPLVLSSRGGVAFRILTVCGRDGLGRPYLNSFHVRYSGGSARATNAIYWRSEGAAIRPPECP